MIKVTDTETAIERCIRLIRAYDGDATITVVLGFQYQLIMDLLGDKCNFIVNPFYKVTNSIASLWFAGEVLARKAPECRHCFFK